MLPGVTTDPKLVSELARKKEDENLEFRRFLSAHHDDSHLLHVIGSEVEAQVDCTSCAACCRETRVQVSTEEVARIAGFLKIRPAEAARMYTEPDPADHTRMLTQPAGACVFLDRNLCMIYEVRPDACHRFPYLTTEESCLGSRLESIWRRAWFCPIIYNTIEEWKHRVGFHTRGHS